MDAGAEPNAAGGGGADTAGTGGAPGLAGSGGAADGGAADGGAPATDPSGDDVPEPLPTGERLVVGVGDWGLRIHSFGGAAWTYCGNPSTGDDHSPDLLRDVAWADGIFIAVGGDTNSMVMSSPDGLHWREDLHPSDACDGESYPASCHNWMGGVAYGDGVWLAGGGNGALMRSLDGGRTWQGLHPSEQPNAVRDIAFGNGRFVAGTDGGELVVSDDAGDSWVAHPLWTEALQVVHGGDAFIAYGAHWNGSGFDRACFVGDALAESFVPCDALVAASTSFVYAGTQWLAAIDATRLATSADATSWVAHAVADVPGELLFDGRSVLGRRDREIWRWDMLDSFERIASDVPSTRAWVAGQILDELLPANAGPACKDLR